MTRLNELLTIGEAAAFVGLSTATLRRYVKQGAVVAVHLPSGRLRFSQPDLEALMTPRLVEVSTPPVPHAVAS